MQDIKVKSESEQIAFFERSKRAFDRACEAVGIEDRYYSVADTTVRLRFAGGRLTSLLSDALEHLRLETSIETPRADVTFCLWDSESTGVEMPRIACDWDQFTNRGDIWGFNSPRIRTAFHWVENSVNLMDLETNTAIYWIQSADGMPFWVPASPLRTLFHWWMETRGRQLLHAAAVGNEHGAVLITGKGGVGKSTTALSAMCGGLKYLADDYLIVGLDPEPTVYSLYSTAKLNPDQVANLPEFGDFVTNQAAPDGEKAVMYLQRHLPDRLTASMPLRAILIPRVQDQTDTGFTATDANEARRAAALTTLSQLPYAGRHSYAMLNRLASALPAYHIELGRELPRIATAISDFLRRGPSQHVDLATAGAAQAGDICPLISVIIPTYNGKRFLRAAIDSVLRQRYPAIEIIVVDDASTDGTEDLIDTLPADVRYYRQAENRGPSVARNIGIRDAAGEYIAFLDVDDYWPDGNLRYLVDEISSGQGGDVVHGHAQLVQCESGTGQMAYVGSPEDAFPYYIGSGLYRRSAFEAVGLFDEELRFGEDTDWYTRAGHQGLAVRKLDEVTLFVRRHGGNMTHGKSLAELSPLRLFKKELDRKREAGAVSSDG